MDGCRGGLNDDSTSTKAMLLLAASASISWVFAKSIQNVSLVRYIVSTPGTIRRCPARDDLRWVAYT